MAFVVLLSKLEEDQLPKKLWSKICVCIRTATVLRKVRSSDQSRLYSALHSNIYENNAAKAGWPLEISTAFRPLRALRRTLHLSRTVLKMASDGKGWFST